MPKWIAQSPRVACTSSHHVDSFFSFFHMRGDTHVFYRVPLPGPLFVFFRFQPPESFHITGLSFAEATKQCESSQSVGVLQSTTFFVCPLSRPLFKFFFCAAVSVNRSEFRPPQSLAGEFLFVACFCGRSLF